MRARSEDNLDTLLKPLYDGSVSIVFFNKDDSDYKDATFALEEASDYITI